MKTVQFPPRPTSPLRDEDYSFLHLNAEPTKAVTYEGRTAAVATGKRPVNTNWSTQSLRKNSGSQAVSPAAPFDSQFSDFIANRIVLGLLALGVLGIGLVLLDKFGK